MIENMERETGIEPATSSLGISVLIVYQQLMRTRRTILYIEHHGESATYYNSVLKVGIVGMHSVPTIQLLHLS
jgi:hypothetical protein